MAKTLHNLWRKAGTPQRQLQNFLSTLKTYQVMATEPLFGELAKRYGYGARKGFDVADIIDVPSRAVKGAASPMLSIARKPLSSIMDLVGFLPELSGDPYTPETISQALEKAGVTKSPNIRFRETAVDEVDFIEDESVGAAKRSGELYNIVEDVIISEFDRRYPKRSKKLMPHHLKDDIFFTAEEKSDRISRMGNVARKDELKRRRESEFRIKELKMKEVMGEKNYKAFRKYGVLYLMKQHGGKSDINYKDLFFGEDVDLKSMIFNQIEVGE